MHVLSIIAGGWSAGLANFDKVPGIKIGVNESFIEADCAVCVTMDRQWVDYRRNDLIALQRPTFIRWKVWRDERTFDHITLFECNNYTPVFSEKPGVLNGTNSAGCALNYAYQQRPQEIYIFGLDGRHGPKGEGRWHKPYPYLKGGGITKREALGNWAHQYHQVVPQFKEAGIKVYTVGNWSVVDAFPRVSLKDLGCER